MRGSNGAPKARCGVLRDGKTQRWNSRLAWLSRYGEVPPRPRGDIHLAKLRRRLEKQIHDRLEHHADYQRLRSARERLRLFAPRARALGGQKIRAV